MKSTYIAIIILIVLVGGFLLWNQSKKAEAPAQNTDTSVPAEVESPTPVPPQNNVNEPTVEKPATAPVKEFTVTAKNFSFMPSTLTVKKGDKVKITFKNTQGFHDFRIDEYGVASTQQQAPSEQVLEFTADKAGSFEYYCSVGEHRAMGMVGTLKVE
jgi:nitrosocyanin